MLAAALSILLGGSGGLGGQTLHVFPPIVESRSYLLNFVPFGVGQFQQRRIREGVFFASTELVLGATSIAAYLAIESLVIERSVTTIDGQTITVRGVPGQRSGEANALSLVKFASGIAFYVLWALGVIEALIHSDDAGLTPSGLSLRF